MINSNAQNISFGRALTTAETQLLSQKLNEAKQHTGIQHIAMNLPIAAVPAEPSKNTGIGTFLGTVPLMEKLAPLTGIDTKLMLPTGIVSDLFGYSPYSSPAFGLYTGYVDPYKLSKPEYGSLLNKFEIKRTLTSKNFKISDEYRTEYQNINRIEAVLDKAYERYAAAPEKHEKLTREFEKFKKEQKYWLEAYAELPWNSPKEPDRFKFKQFIAEKQYQEMRRADKRIGINTIADIPIGNDRVWDRKVAQRNHNGENPFLGDEDTSLACTELTGEVVSWGVPALDPSKKSAHDLIFNKILYNGKHAEGVRLDAFDSVIFSRTNDNKNNDIKIIDSCSIANSIIKGMKKAGLNFDFCFAENKPLKDFGGYEEKHQKTTESFLSQNNLGVLSVYKLGHFYGKDSWQSFYGGHDKPNIHNNNNSSPEGLRNDFINFFGGTNARKYQVMFTDVFGCADNYNHANTTNNGNWKFRLPSDWESLYHRQLQRHVGFNAPEIFAGVLEKKNKGTQQLKQSLNAFAQILKEEGVTTQANADAKYGTNAINKRLTA